MENIINQILQKEIEKRHEALNNLYYILQDQNLSEAERIIFLLLIKFMRLEIQELSGDA